jgi:hypothetical protein
VGEIIDRNNSHLNEEMGSMSSLVLKSIFLSTVYRVDSDKLKPVLGYVDGKAYVYGES